jgi:hypothetical protein
VQLHHIVESNPQVIALSFGKLRDLTGVTLCVKFSQICQGVSGQQTLKVDLSHLMLTSPKPQYNIA